MTRRAVMAPCPKAILKPSGRAEPQDVLAQPHSVLLKGFMMFSIFVAISDWAAILIFFSDSGAGWLDKNTKRFPSGVGS